MLSPVTRQWETEVSIHCVFPPSKTTVITRGYFSKTAKLSTSLFSGAQD